MKARITYLWGDWPSYWVADRRYCKDDFDRRLFDLLKDSGKRCIQIGAVCIERL